MTITGKSGRMFWIIGNRSNPFESSITTSVITKSPSPFSIHERSVFPLSVDFVLNPDLSNFFSNTNLIALSSSAIRINGFFIFLFPLKQEIKR